MEKQESSMSIDDAIKTAKMLEDWCSVVAFGGPNNYGGVAGQGRHREIYARAFSGRLEVVALLDDGGFECLTVPTPYSVRFPAPGAALRAPHSYVTAEGCVQLPGFVRRHLGVQHGGGVVFDTRDKGVVVIMSNETARCAVGEDDKDSP